MQKETRWMIAIPLVACAAIVGSLQALSGGEAIGEPVNTGEPVRVVKSPQGVHQVIVTRTADRRLALQTSAVRSVPARKAGAGVASARRKAIPYAALMFNARGQTY